MKHLTWEQRLIISLICASVVIFTIKFLVFGDSGESNTLSYIFNSLGFLPINILIVTLIINRLLAMRAKREQQEKMKMVIGLFFSEMGAQLLRLVVASDPDAAEILNILTVRKTWTKEEFAKAREQLSACRFIASPSAENLTKMHELLEKHHEFLLRLIENPVLMDQNSISKLLQDLFHLGEELSSRTDIITLPAPDIVHLGGDVNRVYRQLTLVWLDHMEYLAANYPYLLSLSIRKSPFTTHCDVVVRE